MLVPRLTDETLEVGVGLRIARGEILPLTNYDSYDGALFNYLVAGVFWLLGPRLDAGRLLVLVTGALTVIPTYLLGRSLGGPGLRGQVVGLLGATLLAASATHTVVSSRLAYSHSLTPLATTVGLWLLHRALVGGSGPFLVASGFAFGLALQTHPSALAIWPGLGVTMLLRGRDLLVERRGRWVMLATLAAIIAVSNLVVFNASSDFASISRAAQVSENYVAASETGGRGWSDRMTWLLRSAALALGSQVSEEVEPWRLVAPLVVAMVAFLLLGLASFARRDEWLPLLVIASALLAISYLNGRVEPIVTRARHYALLLPLGLVAVGEGVAVFHGIAVELGMRRRVAHGAFAGAFVVLVASSVSALWAYQADRSADPLKNNATLLAVLDAVRASGPRHETVYIDQRIGDLRTLSGGRTLEHLRFAFDLVGQQHAVVSLEGTDLPIGRSGSRPRRLVMRSDSLPVVQARYRLVAVHGEPGPDAPLRVLRARPLARG
jgi:4-amino-4-deoxy-L-arabinose transferase-like glycosyltransferase